MDQCQKKNGQNFVWTPSFPILPKIQITISNLFSRHHNSDLTNKNHKLTQKNTQNDPKQPTQAKTTQNETQNEPKWAKASQTDPKGDLSWSKTSQNDPKPAKTTQKET